MGSQGCNGVFSGPAIKLGGKREGQGGLVLGFHCQLTEGQDFSMLLEGDNVVKQVCRGSENNGKCLR